MLLENNLLFSIRHEMMLFIISEKDNVGGIKMYIF